MTINASPNLVAYVGNDLEIDCVVASWSQADSNYARWLRNEDEIDFEDSSSSATHIFYTKSEFDKDHCSQFMTLNIRKLTFKDSGNYSCAATVNAYPMVIKTMLLTVTVPMKQPNYKSLILKISIPVSVFIIILAISVVLGTYYYQRKCQMKLQKALEEYQKRPLPKKG